MMKEHKRTYSSWAHAIQRCTNPNSHKYPTYGARGITVCDRWLKFRNFLEDMGERPEGTSLDRINNDGNYEPANCRWATSTQQMINQSKRIDNKSGYRGVCWYAARDKWIAYINIHHKRKNLGYFTNLNRAISARKQAESAYWG